MILSKNGGALAKMLPAFKLGLAGRLGSGKQYWSWITLDDAIRAIVHILLDDSLSGPVNIVSPNPITNAEFTKTLGKALHRPTILPTPAFALKMLPGGFAKEMLLSSIRAIPEKITRTGFALEHPDIASAMNAILG